MKEAYQPQEILLPGVEETLQRLRLHDLMMGVVTNRGHSIDDKMESLNLSPYFDFVLTGGDIDVYKPDVRIFEHALKLAQSIPEETIYVGDNYHADVIGARNAGIHPILVNTYDLFPNADCPIIQEIGDLLILLGLE
jgi:putative hydrolase of the HAD superfamily